jgi:hypothetical protein
LVQEIVGNSRRFDFGQSSSRIPKVDLPDLRPFFETALTLGGRRPQLDSNGSLSFRTPEVWREDGHDGAAIRPSYERVTFERNAANDELLLGVGSPLMNAVLRLHESSESTVALLPAELSPELDAPLIIARLYSEETLGPDGPQPSLVAAKVPWATTEPVVLWNDEELLRFCNKLTRPRRSLSSAEVALPPSASEVLLRGLSALNIAARNGTIPHAFRYPAIEPFAVLMVASDRPLGGR